MNKARIGRKSLRLPYKTVKPSETWSGRPLPLSAGARVKGKTLIDKAVKTHAANEKRLLDALEPDDQRAPDHHFRALLASLELIRMTRARSPSIASTRPLSTEAGQRTTSDVRRNEIPLSSGISADGMEHLWSRAVATSCKQWQMARRQERRKQAKSVAVGCDQFPT
jgi:hypothetical protein